MTLYALGKPKKLCDSIAIFTFLQWSRAQSVSNTDVPVIKESYFVKNKSSEAN